MITVRNLKGVDLSHHNNTNTTGIMGELGFGVVKTSEGYNYYDPAWKKHAKCLVEQGCKIGAYHFVRYDTGNNPKDEMDTFINAVRQFNFDFIALDVEAESLKKSGIEYFVNECVRILQGFGMPILIYVQASAAKKFQYLCTNYADVWIWLADWSSESLIDSSTKYGFNPGNVAVWQTGSTSTAYGNVDTNIALEGRLFTTKEGESIPQSESLTLKSFVDEMKTLLDKYKGVI